jgi:hypothetical protein
MRGDREREMAQSLLDGMDVRGLDLSKVKAGAISQHIDRAVGDEYTRLPAGLNAPEAWSAPDTSRRTAPARPPPRLTGTLRVGLRGVRLAGRVWPRGSNGGRLGDA